MSLGLYAFGSSDRESRSDTTMISRKPPPCLRIIAVSGMLAIAGTSSAKSTRLWEEPYVHRLESTASSPSGQFFDLKTTHNSGETTRLAVSELRRISGLTWEQLGQLFGVSRRSVHFWASGKSLSAENETHLMRVLSVIRKADHGDARTTRAALFYTSDNIAPFDLLMAQRFEEAQQLLGSGVGRRMVARTALSDAARAARQPLPPEQLVESLHDKIHTDLGKGRAARTVKATRSGRG